jgi:hypothetical protein
VWFVGLGTAIAGRELDSDALLLAGNRGSVHVPLAVIVDGARVEGRTAIVQEGAIASDQEPRVCCASSLVSYR